MGDITRTNASECFALEKQTFGKGDQTLYDKNWKARRTTRGVGNRLCEGEPLTKRAYWEIGVIDTRGHLWGTVTI